jgi:hypothetical protein
VGFGLLLADLLPSRDATQVRHLEINEHYVRLEIVSPRNRFSPITSLTRRLNPASLTRARTCILDRCQPLANDLLVINE